MIQIHRREQRLHWVKAGSWVYSQHCSFANTFNNVNSHCALCAVQFMAENTHFSSKHFIYSHGGQLSWRTQSNSKWQTKKHKIKLERGVERACVGCRRTHWATFRVCLSWSERKDLMGCSMILEQSFTQLCISGCILKVEGVEPDKRECEGTLWGCPCWTQRIWCCCWGHILRNSSWFKDVNQVPCSHGGWWWLL